MVFIPDSCLRRTLASSLQTSWSWPPRASRFMAVVGTGPRVVVDLDVHPHRHLAAGVSSSHRTSTSTRTLLGGSGNLRSRVIRGLQAVPRQRQASGQRRSRGRPGKKKKEEEAGELEAEEGKRSRLLRCELHHRAPQLRPPQTTGQRKDTRQRNRSIR